MVLGQLADTLLSVASCRMRVLSLSLGGTYACLALASGVLKGLLLQLKKKTSWPAVKTLWLIEV